MSDGAENHVAASELVSTELDSEEITVVRVIQPANEVHIHCYGSLIFVAYIHNVHCKCTSEMLHSVAMGIELTETLDQIIQ